jgi:proteasome alpha subunit
MGGTTEPIITALKESYSENAELADAVRMAVDALRAGISSSTGSATPAAEPRVLGPATLEVAVLDASRPRRAFRRITGPALTAVLPAADA